MTKEEFLKALQPYESMLEPKTLAALKEAIQQDRFEPEAQVIVLEELRKSKAMMKVVEEAKEEQDAIYREGIQKLEKVKKNAVKAYKEALTEAEAESEKQDKQAVKTLLKTI